jgi:PAS domain S-box-containing protein
MNGVTPTRGNGNRIEAPRDGGWRPHDTGAILHLDEDGVIRDADARAAVILGRPVRDIVGRAPRSLATDEGEHGFPANPHGPAEGELEVERADGARPCNRLVALPVPGGAVCAIFDVTQQRPHDGELQQRARELDELYNDAPCGYHSLDASGVVIQVNDTELRWLGYDRRMVIGRMPFTDLLAGASAERFRHNFELLKSRGTMRDYEYEMRRKDGTSFPVLLSATAVRTPEGNLMRTRASVFDITKEKWANEEVRRYAESLHAASRRLVELQEAERRSLANALHDLVGQKLTALSINLNILRSQADPALAAATDGRLVDCLKLVEETVESIRDVMAELRPAVLDDYGLPPVLRWYAETFSRRTGVRTEVVTEGPERRLPPPVEEAFFRIAQEALANVAKYARAGSVRIALHTADGDTALVIADDGRGFVVDDGHPAHDHGWGLALMRERAAAIGAEVDVHSAPGRGTTIGILWRGPSR